MKRERTGFVWALAALLVLGPVSAAGIDLTFFTVEANFQAACTVSVTEDFSCSAAEPGGVCSGASPLDSSTNDGCFNACLSTGWDFTALGIGAYAAIGTGFLGVGIPAVGPNYFTDESRFNFSPAVECVGFKVIGDLINPVTVDCTFQPSGEVVTSGGSLAGTFVGAVSSGAPITSVDCVEQVDGSADLYGALQFGFGPVGPTSIEVSKTAALDVEGRTVSGTIQITNVGENPAVISAVEDTLEVHFPRVGKSAPPPLPEGSTRNWFEVAEVPVANPGFVEVGDTVEIDYSFDLCTAEDFSGANSMRNVVAVTLANKPEKARKDTVVTRSDSFQPQTPECPVGPVTEDLSPCFSTDTWEFEVTAGETVFLEADTVDAGTAADLCFLGSCPADFFDGDDNFACTFPPPAFSCPRDQFVASASGTCTVQVRTCSSACFDSGTANYSLTVQRDGMFTDLTLVGDDQ